MQRGINDLSASQCNCRSYSKTVELVYCLIKNSNLFKHRCKVAALKRFSGNSLIATVLT